MLFLNIAFLRLFLGLPGLALGLALTGRLLELAAPCALAALGLVGVAFFADWAGPEPLPVAALASLGLSSFL